MNDLNKIAERLVQMSHAIERFDEQLKKHGVRRHMLGSCKEALLGVQGIIESAVEIIEETEKKASAGQELRKVQISD
ncbi:hypothetical protein [Candidatus Pristimantibacillus sp. PTI5]|uniref:hypothetical protein n=1 Tax=Candidatus Pristimantibacillus sp. PTI5 TaxID=3400422 RepID=UPI003B014CBE